MNGMNGIMRLWIASVLAAFVACACSGATNDVLAVEEKGVLELRAENEALRKENQRLRMELVRQRGGTPVIDLSNVKEGKEVEGAAENGPGRFSRNSPPRSAMSPATGSWLWSRRCGMRTSARTSSPGARSTD